MKSFKAGEQYQVKLSSGKRYGEQVGICEIIEVKEVPYSELNFGKTCIKGWDEAVAGEITVRLITETTNDQPKTFLLNLSKCSEGICKEYSPKEPLEYWFSPGKRNYQSINARKDQIGAERAM